MGILLYISSTGQPDQKSLKELEMDSSKGYKTPPNSLGFRQVHQCELETYFSVILILARDRPDSDWGSITNLYI